MGEEERREGSEGGGKSVAKITYAQHEDAVTIQMTYQAASKIESGKRLSSQAASGDKS